MEKLSTLRHIQRRVYSRLVRLSMSAVIYQCSDCWAVALCNSTARSKWSEENRSTPNTFFVHDTNVLPAGAKCDGKPGNSPCPGSIICLHPKENDIVPMRHFLQLNNHTRECSQALPVACDFLFFAMYPVGNTATYATGTGREMQSLQMQYRVWPKSQRCTKNYRGFGEGFGMRKRSNALIQTWNIQTKILSFSITKFFFWRDQPSINLLLSFQVPADARCFGHIHNCSVLSFLLNSHHRHEFHLSRKLCILLENLAERRLLVLWAGTRAGV